MNVSQKCQYALRALFELAKSSRAQPRSTPDIAAAQAIPPKFLELILSELKHGGFVESRRGMRGGYILRGRADRLTVGEVIRFVDGPIGPVRCVQGIEQADCALYGDCAFLGMWSRASDAVNQVFDSTTFQDLIDEELYASGQRVADYCI